MVLIVRLVQIEVPNGFVHESRPSTARHVYFIAESNV